ncbi:MAG: TonB-dependent receptor, partial [Acidobacteria bacterium]|nr:TonB-dependent receptor [Acidobacteriota bacterium]
GVYNIPNLDVGGYVLRVTAPGFSTFERSDLNLISNQVLNIHVEMAVGATSSVVEVKGTSPTITTETNDLSGTMGSKAVRDLPIVSRHTGDGGVFAYTTLNTGAAAVGGSVIPAFGGARVQTGSMPTMDGIAVMAYPFGANPVQPSLESVQEITVVKSSGPAEFATAANIKVVSKSGSNEFHGGAFWAYTGNSLMSRTFFASSVPFRVYNNFGASLGGPIKKNKLFFFGTYEGSRESAKVITFMDTPIPAYRTGDFSSLLGKVTVKNPFTGQPFPNNQISPGLISSVSQKAQDYYYPLPNTGAPGQVSSNWQAQYRGTTGFTIFDHFDIRGDYNISNRDTVFARVSWRRMPLEYTDVYPLHVTQLRRSRSGVAAWTHTISPAAVNEFRFGATFHVNPYFADVVGSDLVKQFGIQGITTTGIHNAPGFTITGVSSADLDSAGDNFHNNPTTNYEWIDTLSWTRGSHLMKFGVDIIRDQLNGGNIASNVYGGYNFSGVYSGLGYADFLLGIPQTTSVSVPNPPRDFRGTTLGMFAQDQFKVSRSLTLNYGIRWSLPMPYTSKAGAMYSFNPATGTLVVPDNGVVKLNPFYPKNLTSVAASQAGFPAGALIDFHKASAANLQPRVGFAYKLFGSDKSVIRGGYGIYSSFIYSTLAAQNMLGGPFSGSVTYVNSITNGVPLFSMPSPFLPSGSTSVQNVTGVNPHMKLPYTQQWNMTLEQQVGALGFRVSYLGSRTSQLLYRRNLNTPAPSTTPFTNARKAYPLFNQVIYADSGGSELYNALEVSAERRFGQNLTFNSGYTWSKDVTDTQESSPFAGQVIQNPYNRTGERANSNYSLPQRVFAYALYRLPMGKGQLLLPNGNKVVETIFGGWDTSWTMVAQSGQFFTPTFSGFDPSNTNTLGGRPDRLASGVLNSGRSISRWFDASAFAIPGCPSTTPVCSSPASVGRFGNSGINILHGPKVFNLDFGLTKSFHVQE